MQYNRDKRTGAIILPGVVIKECSRKALDHSSGILRFANTANAILSVMPGDYKLHIQCCPEPPEGLLESVINGEFYVNKDIDYKCKYFIGNPGPLWTIVSDEDLRKLATIYTSRKTYNHAITIMTDAEVEMLANIIVIESDKLTKDDIIVHITAENYRSRDIYREFTYMIKNIPLLGKKRYPCRIVEGITQLCTKCNHIIYCKYMKSHNCKL
jgi:hypothetical protein